MGPQRVVGQSFVTGRLSREGVTASEANTLHFFNRINTPRHYRSIPFVPLLLCTAYTNATELPTYTVLLGDYDFEIELLARLHIVRPGERLAWYYCSTPGERDISAPVLHGFGSQSEREIDKTEANKNNGYGGSEVVEVYVGSRRTYVETYNQTTLTRRRVLV